MPSPDLTVRYNRRCPVCDAGIHHQRNKLIAAVKAGTIEFCDINLQPDALARYGASQCGDASDPRFVYDRLADILYAWNSAKNIGKLGHWTAALLPRSRLRRWNNFMI